MKGANGDAVDVPRVCVFVIASYIATYEIFHAPIAPTHTNTHTTEIEISVTAIILCPTALSDQPNVVVGGVDGCVLKTWPET